MGCSQNFELGANYPDAGSGSSPCENEGVYETVRLMIKTIIVVAVVVESWSGEHVYTQVDLAHTIQITHVMQEKLLTRHFIHMMDHILRI